jgi:hypothetical protein
MLHQDENAARLLADAAIDHGFHGSYDADDCTFLLKRIAPADAERVTVTSLEDQERGIQSGSEPYWVRVTPESAPSGAMVRYYAAAMNLNAERFGADVARLALTLSMRPGKEVVVVSLARAGTPVGVLLCGALRHLGRKCKHYSVSIVRSEEIGLDLNALKYIVDRHDSQDIVFVDGWTGKGGMSRQLALSVAQFNARHGTAVGGTLAVVADLAGWSELAATTEDYLLPYAVFNAVVSGLVSRTVFRDDLLSAQDYHGCLELPELLPFDRSREFIELVELIVFEALADGAITAIENNPSLKQQLRQAADRWTASLQSKFGLTADLVKLGIGESTRALGRRLPKALIVRDPADPHVAHLVDFAAEKGVETLIDNELPYRCAVVQAKVNS